MIYSDLKIDELNVDGKKEYTKHFEENGSQNSIFTYWLKAIFSYKTILEKLLLSCELTKINDAKKKQKRKFILTNRAIYNFDTKSTI